MDVMLVEKPVETVNKYSAYEIFPLLWKPNRWYLCILHPVFT